MNKVSSSRSSIVLLFLVLVSFIAGGAMTSDANAATLVVPDTFTTIQAAVDAASSGDTVLVKPGVYFEHISITNKNIILTSSEGAEKTIIDGSGTGRPLYGTGASNTVIDGFTFTNGRATWGAGVYIGNCWVTIRNCIITKNTADYNGGGIYAGSYGGASLDKCVISDNTAGYYGGGMYGTYGGVGASNSVITGNHAGVGGGAGGAMGFCAQVRVSESKVTGNSSGQYGGAFYVRNTTRCATGALAINSIVSGNTASQGGALFVDWDGSALVASSTVVGNTADQGGSIYYASDVGRLAIVDSIIYHNTTPAILSGTGIQLTYTDIEGGFSGTGNIDADPLFVDLEKGNFHLQKESPCIDAAAASSPYNQAIDIEGNTRPLGTAPDMGAYETVLNRAPVAEAGPDQKLELQSCAGASVRLDGSGSSDPDNDPLTYTWSWNGGSATGVQAVVTLPYGTTSVTLTVDDGKGGSASDTVTIVVADTVLPGLSVNVSPSTLWPPNHRLVAVTPTVLATDACKDFLIVELLSVLSNEPDNGTGDGDTANDIVINTDGTISLRAERSGAGSGRIYTITYRAIDRSGNSTSASASVTVPHNKGK